MADNWPSTLPSPLADSVNYDPQPNAVRTEMAAAVAKVRRRFTGTGTDFRCVLVLSQEQVDILETFCTDTLAEVLPFQWSDFRKPIGPANVRLYRFKRRPRHSRHEIPGYWRAELELEMLP